LFSFGFDMNLSSLGYKYSIRKMIFSLIMANALIHVDYLDNGRNGFYLIHAGFKFSVKNRYKDKCYWRCVNRECPATVTTDQQTPVRFGSEHNHPSDITGITAEAFISDLKKLCRENISPIPSLYDDALGSLRNRDCDETVEQVIAKIPTFDTCSSSLYRSRSKLLPKLPQTQADIDLNGEWTETLAGEQFLLHDDTDERGDRIMIFGTISNLIHLCDSTIVLADGTFYSCTGLLTQLHSLHGDIGGTLFPLFCSFTEKDGTYIFETFQYIERCGAGTYSESYETRDYDFRL